MGEPELDLLRRVGVYEEPFGSYQVDAPGAGDFLSLPYKEGTLQAAGSGAMLDPMLGKMRVDGHSKKVRGHRSCTLNLGVTLHSHGRNLTGVAAPPTAAEWALLRLMKAIMGGSVAAGTEAAETEVQAGSTATDVILTAGHGDRFSRGMPVALETVADSDELEVAEVLSVAGDTLSLKQALSAAPIEGSAVRGGVTCYPTEDPDTSIQAIVEGRGITDAVMLRGLQGGWTLELPPGELGTISFALAGASWDPIGASGITIPVYANVMPITCKPLRVCCPLIGSTSRVELDVDAITIQPNFTYAPQRSGRAREGVARMRRQAVRPLFQGSFLVPYEDDTWTDAWEDGEDRALFVTAGSLAGGILFVALPTIQITDVKPAVTREGLRGQTVSYEARHDEEAGSEGGTEMDVAVGRVSWL